MVYVLFSPWEELCFPLLSLIITNLWDVQSKDDWGHQDVQKTVTQPFFGNKNDTLAFFFFFSVKTPKSLRGSRGEQTITSWGWGGVGVGGPHMAPRTQEARSQECWCHLHTYRVALWMCSVRSLCKLHFDSQWVGCFPEPQSPFFSNTFYTSVLYVCLH